MHAKSVWKVLRPIRLTSTNVDPFVQKIKWLRLMDLVRRHVVITRKYKRAGKVICVLNARLEIF